MLRWLLNVGSSYLRFAVAAVVVLAMTPWIIGRLGVDAYGTWAIALAVTGILGLADFGLATAAVRFVAERTGAGDSGGRNRVVSTLFTLYTGLGSLVLAGAGLWYWQRPAGATGDWPGGSFTLLIAATVALAFQLSLFRAVLAGAGRMYIANLVEISTTLAYAGLTIALVSAGWGIEGLAAALAGATGLGVLGMAVASFRGLGDLRVKLRLGTWPEISPLLAFSGWAFLANAAVLVILRADALVLKSFVPLSAIAIYAVAGKVAEYALLLNKQFSNALMPLISQARGSGSDATVRAVLVDGTRYLLAIAVPLVSLMAWHADALIRLWLGDGFADSSPVLRILAAAAFASVLQLNAANVLGMTGRHRTVAMAMAGSAASKLALTVVLVPAVGLAGAAMATLVSAVVFELGLILPLACRHVGVAFTGFVRSAILPVLPALGPVLAAAVALDRYAPAESLGVLLAQCAGCGLLYLAGFWATGLTSTERSGIVALVSRRASRAQLNGESLA